MDLTGRGWRCAKCTAQSMLANTRGQPSEMNVHFTRDELEALVAKAGMEAGAGAFLVVGGFAASLVSLAISTHYMVVFGGVFATGFGMFVHGLRRRKLARAALRDAPDARVVRR